jgi:hypothetical protein
VRRAHHGAARDPDHSARAQPLGLNPKIALTKTRRHKEHKEKQIIEGVEPITTQVTPSRHIVLRIFVIFVSL